MWELSISCDNCVRRDTPTCRDCLVTHVLGEEPATLEISASDSLVVDLLTAEGLLPILQYREKTGGESVAH